VVVLLLAHRYGYRLADGNADGKSITQLAYEEGCRNPGKPRLVFTVDPDHRPCRHGVAMPVVTDECGP
jgi:hypothetical protein